MTAARERAARAAREAYDNWIAPWEEQPEYKRDDWRAVVDAVAAELGEPVHEVTCPNCATTIRARMADAPGVRVAEGGTSE